MSASIRSTRDPRYFIGSPARLGTESMTLRFVVPNVVDFLLECTDELLHLLDDGGLVCWIEVDVVFAFPGALSGSHSNAALKRQPPLQNVDGEACHGM